MQPTKSILDRSFTYVPSTATAVDQTWRRFGWRPSGEGEGAQPRQSRPAQTNQTSTAQQ